MGQLSRRGLLKGAVAGVALSGVGSKGFAQEARGVTAKTIKLGQMVPLTGAVATYGVPIRAGTQAYLGIVNDRGGVNGRKVELITEDNVYSTSQSVALAKKLVGNDGVFALINSQGTAQVAATFPYMFDQEKTPIFGTYGSAGEWFTPPKPIFGIQVLHEDSAAALGRWTAKDGHKSVAVVHIEAASIAKAAKAAEPSFRKVNPQGAVDFVPVKLPTQDYAPVVLQIIQKKPDALIVMLSEPEFIILVRELRNQGFQAPVYAWAAVVTQNAIDVGGKSFEGVRAFSWTNSPSSDLPAVAEYRAALKKYAPSEKPDFISLYAFGETKIFIEALSRVKGPLTHDALYEALHSLKNYDSGVFPPVTFAADRHQGLTSLVPVQVKGNAWIEVGKWVDSANPDW